MTLRSQPRAAALPMVLILMALMLTLLLVSLFLSRTELQASRNSIHAESARAMALSGIDLANGLISANSRDNGFVTYQRVFEQDGVWRIETKIANTEATDPSKPWKRSAVAPVALHSGFAGPDGGVDLNFAVRGSPDAGFIAPRINGEGWRNLSPAMFRMQWIEVYAGDPAEPRNLIGRFAFWVDDESSKLNVNYSGTREIYHPSGLDNSQPLRLSIRGPRPGIPASGAAGTDFNGRIWPLDMELGGVAGLTIQNVIDAIAYRGRPDLPGFKPFPSTLGLRIGTVGGAGGPAVTTLPQQSALAFTAAAYSREDERSFRTGRRRFDLLELQHARPTSAIQGLRDAILGDYPEFAAKYDMDAFASAAFSLVQRPGGNTGPTHRENPAATFGAGPYARGLPLANEVILRVSASQTPAGRVVSLEAEVEMILLVSSTKARDGWNQTRSWTPAGVNQNAYMARIFFDPDDAVTFGGFSPPNPLVVTHPEPRPWFQKWDPAANNVFSIGPRSSDFSGALAVMQSEVSFTTTNPLGAWNFPRQIRVELEYAGRTYQSFVARVVPPEGGIFDPPPDSETGVYTLVLQPSGEQGARGDPRLGIWTSEAAANLVSGLEDEDFQSPPSSSMGAINSSWGLNDFATDPNRPDLTHDALLIEKDRGLPNYVTDMSDGFGDYLAGIGWLGEVPITTASGAPLAFSTPRLWGDGRASVNGGEFPPDWLMLDAVHLNVFPAESDGTFVSHGRLNVNSAKSHFQIPTGSPRKADTVMDSVFLQARTKDFRTLDIGDPLRTHHSLRANLPERVLVLEAVESLIRARNDADDPYSTPFEFLADLAATPLAGNPVWWMAPQGPNPYAATNTTDRRIEGIIRSVAQKITTRGNQFTIFSLGQAVQVTPSGEVMVTGECYLQAVFERAPVYNEATGDIINSPTGAPPMRQLLLRELRY